MKNFLQRSALTAIAASMAFAGSAYAQEADLKTEAYSALQRCAAVAPSCADQVASATGVLVFPEVVSANLIVGGAGGDGVLYVNNEVQGYYDIGKASIGLQAGVDETAMVFVFRSAESLANLSDGKEWELGAESGLTVVKASADASAISGDPIVYVFDSNGLNAEIAVSALRIWEEGG